MDKERRTVSPLEPRSSLLLATAISYERAAASTDCGAMQMEYSQLAQRSRAQAAYWQRIERRALTYPGTVLATEQSHGERKKDL